MPRFDKTGPRGKGPKTGRGLGYCDVEEDYEKETQDVSKKVIEKILGK